MLSVATECTVAHSYMHTDTSNDQGRRLRAPTCPDHSQDQQNYYFEHALTTPLPIPAAPILQDVYNARDSAKEDA